MDSLGIKITIINTYNIGDPGGFIFDRNIFTTVIYIHIAQCAGAIFNLNQKF